MFKLCHALFFLSSFLLLLIPFQASEAVELAFEAEFGKLEPPMEMGKDGKASRRVFIHLPNGKGNAPNEVESIVKGNQGWADFKVFIPTSDTYYLWGRTISPTPSDDSFFVTFDAKDVKDRGIWNGTNDNVWDTTDSLDWIWDRVAGRLNRGVFQRSFKLDAGEHLLRIWNREDGTQLDALFISNDQNANPRTPTDDEVRAQKAGIVGSNFLLAVESAGKLAIIWGKIKLMR